jgi:predicted metalloendopeptidase
MRLVLLALLTVALPRGYGSPDGDRKVAQMLLSSIDPSRDPCMDFYEFTCANWNKSNPIPADAEETDMLSMAGRKVKQKLRGKSKQCLIKRISSFTRPSNNFCNNGR